MNSLAGIQLLCFKNKYMEVFFLCQSFLYWSVKVLKEKWWQWGNCAAVWAASYLLTPSRGGGAPRYPHKSLVSVRGKMRDKKWQKEGWEIKDSQGQEVNMHTCSWTKSAKSHLHFHTSSESWCMDSSSGTATCPLLGAPVMLLCHNTHKKWAG